MDNTPSSIICFKNGFSFVTVPVVLQEDSKNSNDPNIPIKECTIGPLPSFAVHGTVGLQADNPDCVRIFSLSKAPKKDEELLLPPGPDFSYHAFLKANLGTRVRIQTNSNYEKMHAEGRVKWVKPGEDVPLMAILETSENNKKKDQLFDTSNVVHLERIDGLDQSSESSSLLVRYASTGDSAPGSMLSYLTNGLTWAPSYTVLMDKETKTVKLEGKACLLCDLPFLDGGAISEISLVTGKPNMEFQHISDPLASGVSASNFVAQLGRGRQVPLKYDPRGQMLQTNACFQSIEARYDDGPMAAMQEAEGIKGGESVEDFFHYILKNVPLKFNHPLSIPFIEECCNIGYEDIYYLDLDRVNTDGEEQSSVEVKHAITFKNTSGQPLTTAPATILAKTKDSNSKFMVQGMMKYTGPEKNATIEITRTMDVQGKFVIETMKERKTEVINESVEGTGLFGSGSKKLYADSIQKVAKVIIMNSKDVEIKCKVEYQLVGHLEESSPEFKDKMERQRNSLVVRHQHLGLNPTTKYVWEVEIPARGKGEIDFKFCMKEWNHALNNKQ